MTGETTPEQSTESPEYIAWKHAFDEGYRTAQSDMYDEVQRLRAQLQGLQSVARRRSGARR